MKEMYTDTSIIKKAVDQLSCDMSGEAVVLNLKSGMYFGMQDIAASVWNLLERPRTFGEIREAIMQEYDVDAATCESDLRDFIDQMRTAALVDIGDDGAA